MVSYVHISCLFNLGACIRLSSLLSTGTSPSLLGMEMSGTQELNPDVPDDVVNARIEFETTTRHDIDYVPWLECPFHFPMYLSASINLFYGALPRRHETRLHAHAHNMLAVSLVEITKFVEQRLIHSPNALACSTLTENICSIPFGQCFTCTPESRDIPFVHKIRALDEAAIFLCVESSLRPPPNQIKVPQLTCIPGSSTPSITHVWPATHFSAAVTVRARPGTHGIFCSQINARKLLESNHIILIGRLICTLQGELDTISVTNKPDVPFETFSKCVEGVPIQVKLIIPNLESRSDNLQTSITNTGHEEWLGVIADLYAQHGLD